MFKLTDAARRTIRTTVQAVLMLAAGAPLIYEAATQHDAAAAAGGAGVALGVAAGVTRVMALPVVESFLQKYVPWLAAAPDVEAYRGQHAGS
ncbi:MAG TPA: hypothetical protein VIQ30_22720 [Pseudonocardia sp.]